LNFGDFPITKLRKTNNSWDGQFSKDPNSFIDLQLSKDIFKPEEICDADHTTEATSLAYTPQLSSPQMGETNTHRGFDMSSNDAESTSKAEDLVSELFEVLQNQTQSDDILNLIEKKVSADNKKLIALISKSLGGQNPTDNEVKSINCLERCILEGIIEKKKVKKDNAKNRKKREEEKQKLFFKGVLKYTEQEFFADTLQSKKKVRRKQLDRSAYYDYYWGEAARNNGLDISNFYHPNKRISTGKTTAQIISAQNPGLKTLNTTYIELILSSSRFRAATVYYLNSVFIQEALKSRAKKIAKMMAKLQSVALQSVTQFAGQPEHEQDQLVGLAVKNYIVSNPKSKLPWSDPELQDVKDYAISTLNKQGVCSSSVQLFC